MTKRVLILFLIIPLLNFSQNTLEAARGILTNDTYGDGVQNWGDGVTIQAFNLDGTLGRVRFDSQFRDEGFGVEGARWHQIDYYEVYNGQTVNASEKLVINFNGPVEDLVLRVGMMGANEGHPDGETGIWKGYDASGNEIASGVLGANDSNLGSEVRLVPTSYGIYPIDLNASQPIHSISVEASGFGYGEGDPRNASYGENNSDFNVVAITYTRMDGNSNDNVFAVNDTPGPVREDIGLTSFSYDVFLANDQGDNIDIVSFDFSGFPGVIEDDPSERSFTFRTAVNFNGTIDIPYTISNGQETSSAIITLTITDIIDELTIGEDGPYTTDTDTPIEIAISDLLSNDTANNFGGPITIELTEVDNAVNGSVAIVGDNVVFTPVTGFVGEASFTYNVDVLSGSVFGSDKRVDEGTSSAIAINVEGDVVAPPSINQQAVLVSKSNENETLQVNATGNRTSVTLGDCVDQGQVWTISDRGNGFHKFINNYSNRALEGWTRNPSNGDDVTIYSSNNFDWQQWEIIDAGNDYFKIKGKYNARYLTSTNGNAILLDENSQDNQLWKLLDPDTFECTTANNPPVAVNDFGFEVVAGETLIIPFEVILSNDSDIDEDDLTITQVTDNLIGVTSSIVGETIEFSAVNSGPESLEYTLSDGRGGVDFGIISINVLEVTSTISATNDTPGPVREDIGLTSFSYDVFLANDTGDNIDIVSFDFSGFPGIIEDDSSDRTITFRTAVNFNGTIDIPYTISNGQETSSAIITLTITDIIDELTIGEDGPYTTDTDTPIEIAISDLLSNDTANNFGGPITIELTEVDNAVNGSVAIVGDNVVFTPVTGFVGEASFTYNVDVLSGSVFGSDKRVDEGTSSAIAINVEGDVVAPPSINQQAVLVSKSNENETLQVNATGNRTSVTLGDCVDQGQVWTISDRGNGFHKFINNYSNRALEGWTRNPSNGDDVTIYSSNNFDWQQWEIIDAGNDYFKIKGKYNARYLTSTNGNAILLDENSQDNQLWRLLDPNTFSCTTENNPPVAGADGNPIGDPDYTLAVGETLVFSFAQLLANDTDTDGDSLTITAVNNERGSNIVEIVGETVEFTGVSAFPGALFTYTLSDGNGGTDTGFVSLNVLPAPSIVANNDTPGPVREDIGLTSFSYDVFLANDQGDNIDIVSFDFSGFPGVIEDDPSERSFTFRTAVNFNGTIDIPYTISNGQETSSAIITLTITDIIDELTIGEDGPYTTDTDTPIEIAISDLLSNDTANNFGGPITIELTEVDNAVNGSVAIVGDNVVFTPVTGFVGEASFTYNVDVLSGSVFGSDKRVDEGTSSAITINVEGDVLSTTDVVLNSDDIILDGTTSAQQWGGCTTISAYSIDGNPEVIAISSGRLGINGGRYRSQLDYDPSSGNTERFEIDFNRMVNNITFNLGNLEINEYQDSDETGTWSLYNLDNDLVATGDISPSIGVISGPSTYNFSIGNGFKGSKLVLEATGYNHGQYSDQAGNNSDYSLISVSFTHSDTSSCNANRLSPEFDLSSIKVYPTVFENEFFISNKSKENFSIKSIAVFNQSGNLIKKIDKIEEGDSINMSRLRSGFYYIKVYSNNGYTMHKVFKK